MEQKIACPLLYYEADATLKNLMPSGHSSVKPITIKHHVFQAFLCKLSLNMYLSRICNILGTFYTDNGTVNKIQNLFLQSLLSNRDYEQ